MPFKQISDFLTSGSLTLAGVLLLSYCNPFWGLILVIYLLLYLDWIQKRAKEENTSSCHIYLGLAIFGDFYILVAIDFLAEGKLKVNLTQISMWTSYFLRVKLLPIVYNAVFVVSLVVSCCVQCSCDVFCQCFTWTPQRAHMRLGYSFNDFENHCPTCRNSKDVSKYVEWFSPENISRQIRFYLPPPSLTWSQKTGNACDCLSRIWNLPVFRGASEQFL